MADAKDEVAASIVRARADLEEALCNLEKLPAFDPGTVAYAAHALNNYLTVTSGATHLLLSALRDHSDPRIRTWLEGVQHATNLMGHVVTGLINNSYNATVAKLKFEKVDLPLLVGRACAYYEKKAQQKQIHLASETQNGPRLVWADRVAVAAVMDNLLSNAVKYSPHEKQVTVTIRTEPGFIVCGVQDEGPGLSQDDQLKLFQKGVRLSSAPTGGEPSSGYGLAVAKDLVEQMGGTIWCESKPGEGASFWIRLPAYNEQLHESHSG